MGDIEKGRCYTCGHSDDKPVDGEVIVETKINKIDDAWYFEVAYSYFRANNEEPMCTMHFGTRETKKEAEQAVKEAMENDICPCLQQRVRDNSAK